MLALDIVSQLAIAAGLEALRDAGIPLVRAYRATPGKKKVPMGWMLPESLRDGTGVIFASAFPGYDALVKHLANNGDDGEGRFDRRFLFQVLAFGHAQFAQFIGARGPNTSVKDLAKNRRIEIQLLPAIADMPEPGKDDKKGPDKDDKKPDDKKPEKK